MRRMSRREPCERCGAAPAGGPDVGSAAGLVNDNVPWCAACAELLRERAGDAGLRHEYRLAYMRAYMRRRRAGGAEARPKWRVTAEDGRDVRVTLRSKDGRVIACGGFRGMDAGRRLVFGVLGASRSGAEVRTSGGGRGSRKQSRFRIVAALGAGGCAAFLATMAAMVASGGATRVATFTGSAGSAGASTTGSGSRARPTPTRSPGR